MKLGEHLSDKTERKRKTIDFWEKVVKDFTIHKIPVPTIARMYVNPQTNKPYTPRHIYLILRRYGVMI